MSNESEGLFDRVPGPSPWYLVPDTPWYSGPYIPTVGCFRWLSRPGKFPSSGKTLLIGHNGPVAILNQQSYVMVLDESTLLVWHQERTLKNSLSSLPVRLFVIVPSQMKSLGGDLASLCEQMDDRKEDIALGGTSAEVSLTTNNTTDELIAEFPESLRSIDELLILCGSSGISTQPDTVNLALLVAHPRKSSYRLYPQDWFNTAGLDYGYQWVTRVARNPQTGHIHGEGFRISPFILDDSLRGLRRS